jgi:hypothetical protein
MQNRSGNQKNNTSGFRGVSFSKHYGKWFAYIWVDGRRISLGHHDEVEKAAAIAKFARKIYMPFCNENLGGKEV